VAPDRTAAVMADTERTLVVPLVFINEDYRGHVLVHGAPCVPCTGLGSGRCAVTVVAGSARSHVDVATLSRR